MWHIYRNKLCPQDYHGDTSDIW